MRSDADTVDEWRENRKWLGRRKLDRIERRRLIWPAESPANRETFDRWYSMALRVVHDADVRVDTLAAFPLVILYNSGQVKRSNAELADAAGGISERSVIRHLKQYEALGVIGFERGWRISPKSKKPIETRAIVLCWPGGGAYESDTGGHTDRLETGDTGGHQYHQESDTGGHGEKSAESDTGGHRNGDTGGHGITSDTSDGTVGAPEQPSGGRASGRPAEGSALPVPSESIPTGQSQNTELDITAGSDGTARPGSQQTPSEPATYAAMSRGW